MGAARPPSRSGSARFPLSRRLKHRRLIEPLFDRQDPESRSVYSGSIRILYRFVSPDTLDAPFQVGVAVGRSRGNAPRRNRIKRIIRDALRHDQDRLERIVSVSGMALTAMVLFQGRDQDGSAIRADLDDALNRLEERATSPVS